MTDQEEQVNKIILSGPLYLISTAQITRAYGAEIDLLKSYHDQRLLPLCPTLLLEHRAGSRFRPYLGETLVSIKELAKSRLTLSDVYDNNSSSNGVLDHLRHCPV
jgi:hypothetical protein